MSNVKEIIQAESGLLQNRVKDLYNTYYSKVKFLIDNNNIDSSTISSIEELAHNLNVEVTLLERNYVNLCIKLLTKID
ncbi:MAG: hypothetical protein LBD41_03235 [Clostridiales Family XIII bacterium]|jgi:hypothetical protein|nr:hypothetical protein [Clostridiales Family XIII bacterium]